MLFSEKGGKVGLALGGGVARGLAHIGVLKVLEEERIGIDLVAGTSVGSLIGALFCSGLGWRHIYEAAVDVRWKDLVRPALPGLGLVKTDRFERMVGRLIRDARFEDLKIPFKAVAVDITTGEEVVLDRGPVALAVRASCSLPGIFEPTAWEGRLLVDGGLVNDVPADVVRRMGAERVIGVDLNHDRVSTRPPDSLIDVIIYSLNILIRSNIQKGITHADCLVVPDLEGFGYRNLRRLEECIERGEAAMRGCLAGAKTRRAVRPSANGRTAAKGQGTGHPAV
jgi:NTE family protein